MPVNDLMPREKALNYGISSLTNIELLALVLKTGYGNRDVFHLANDVIDMANGFENLLSLTYEELIYIKGIKKAKAMELLAILEISKRLSKIDMVKQEELKDMSKVIDWLKFTHGFSKKEEFIVLYLNARNAIIKTEVEFTGNKNSSVVGIDQILRKALLLKANSIIVAHNHPSGVVVPSHQDIEVTNTLSRGCKLVGIELLDHLIISNSDYFSFRQMGLLC